MDTPLPLFAPRQVWLDAVEAHDKYFYFDRRMNKTFCNKNV